MAGRKEAFTSLIQPLSNVTSWLTNNAGHFPIKARNAYKQYQSLRGDRLNSEGPALLLLALNLLVA